MEGAAAGTPVVQAAAQGKAGSGVQGNEKKKEKKTEVVWSDEDKAKLRTFEEGNIEEWKKVLPCCGSTSRSHTLSCLVHSLSDLS
jgi:hypothetical protein